MVKLMVFFGLLGLSALALALSGCGVSQDEYDQMRAELDSAQSEIKNLQSELASLRGQIESWQESPAQRQSGIRLPGGLVTQSAKLTRVADSGMKEQVTGRKSEPSFLLNSSVTQSYQFEIYNRGTYQWTLTIPLGDYFYYKEKPRPTSSLRYSAMTTNARYYYFSEYIAMAADPDDDDLIEGIVNNVNEMAATENLSERQKIDLVLQFIQSLPYTEDGVTTPYIEYPRYPIETLFDPGGDCEDTSILAVAILKEMGYDVALILFEEFDHMGVGITYDLEYGNSWIYEGKRYWYLDTTGGWTTGWAPKEYAQTPAYIYPVKR